MLYSAVDIDNKPTLSICVCTAAATTRPALRSELLWMTALNITSGPLRASTRTRQGDFSYGCYLRRRAGPFMRPSCRGCGACRLGSIERNPSQGRIYRAAYEHRPAGRPSHLHSEQWRPVEPVHGMLGRGRLLRHGWPLWILRRFDTLDQARRCSSLTGQSLLPRQGACRIGKTGNRFGLIPCRPRSRERADRRRACTPSSISMIRGFGWYRRRIAIAVFFQSDRELVRLPRTPWLRGIEGPPYCRPSIFTCSTSCLFLRRARRSRLDQDSR